MHVHPGIPIEILHGVRANLQDMGYSHESVKHADGQFSKTLPRRMTRMVTTMGKVHTNTIDGYWGSFKNAMRGMKSLRREHQPLFLAEFAWRHNESVLHPHEGLFHRILRALAAVRDNSDIVDKFLALRLDD